MLLLSTPYAHGDLLAENDHICFVISEISMLSLKDTMSRKSLVRIEHAAAEPVQDHPMSSPLEKIPCDVLQYISVLACSSSPFDPPVEILRLMQTGPVLYHALNIRNAPHVYAGIFASKFDTAALFRRYRSTITDSALVAELVNRCRLLLRCKRRDISTQNLLKDLSTALWMYLESDGRNELQLLHVGFPDFILSAARIHLKGIPSRSETHSDLQPILIGRIVIWLLCFALSRRFILNIPELGRKELYALIFPFILSSEKTFPPFTPCRPVLDSRGFRIPAYRLPHAAFIPNPSIPAGNLASVIFESGGMQMPPHLPETRGIQDIVPTKSDFRAFADYETPLFADSLIPDDLGVVDISGTPRSVLHDLELRPLLVRTPLDGCYPKTRYTIGSLTAVWEGVFRTIGAPAGSEAPDALSSYSAFAKPIQCALNEYVNDDHISTKGHMEPLSLSDISLSQGGSELQARGCKYRRHNALMDPMKVHDVILHGETLENHDHAWGGYKFWGVVDEDGKVTLKRTAKEGDASQGVWEFVGRLRFGSVLIGRWRMTGNSDNAYNGIFSMTRM